MDISNYSITKLAEMAIQKPEDFGYWGPEDMFSTWGFAGHDESGMSKNLEKSNFHVISEDLIERFPEDFRIEEYKHWACGWVKRLTCRVFNEPGNFLEDNITEAFKAAMDWHNKLEDYPIADETHYYDLQAEDIVSSIMDLPKYIVNMIDEDIYDWPFKIIECLEQEMGIYIDPDAELYPKDEDILMAVYIKELWNPENISLWEEFCSRKNLEYPPRKNNPNQLNIFGD